MPAGRPLTVVKMVSKLEDRDSFLDAYQAFVDADSVVVFSRELPPKGSRQRFSIHLKNGDVIVAGVGIVAERAPRTDGTNRPAKMRLNIVKLDPGGDEVMAELLERKRRAMAATPPLPPPPPGPQAAKSASGDSVGAAVKALAEAAAEARAPRASDTLPANPLSQITDETLEGFVECVLHEDYEPVPAERDDAAHAGDDEAAPWSDDEPEVRPAGSPRLVAVRAPTPAPAPEPTPVPAADEPAPVVPPPQPVVKNGLGTNLLIALLAGAAGIFGTYFYLHRGDQVAAVSPAPRASDGPLLAAKSAPAPQRPVEHDRPAVADPAPDVAADPADSPTAADPQVADDPPATAPGSSSDTGADSAEQPAADDAVADPPADPAPADDSTGAVEGDGSCHVSVKSYADARVYFDEERIGHPPVDREVPCGTPIKVAIKHPRYEEVERTVVPEPGNPAEVDVTLVRPDVKIKLSSVPPGATMAIDGDIVGHAPARATIKAYTSVWVTASLDGYKPWSKRIRVSKRGGSFTARLAPIPGAR